jgi:hypothetical protein
MIGIEPGLSSLAFRMPLDQSQEPLGRLARFWAE